MSNLKIAMSEEKCRAFIEHAGDAIFIMDHNKKIVDVNHYASVLSGYSKDELLHMHISSLVCGDGFKEEDIFTTTAEGNMNQLKERKVLRKDCTWVDAEINARALNGKGYISVIRDITDRKKMEGELVESREQLAMFIEHSPASLAMFDNNMRYIATSRRWLNDYNLGDMELTGKTHYEVFPDIPQHWKDIHKRCLRGAIEKNEEDAFIRSDGSKEWMRWEIRPWHKADGGIGGIIMFTEVISQRKNATELFRCQFLNSPDILLVINKFHKVETINRSIPGGRPVEELIGEDCVSLLPEESRGSAQKVIEKCFETGENQEMELKLSSL